jgi:hypothetical protein
MDAQAVRAAFGSQEIIGVGQFAAQGCVFQLKSCQELAINGPRAGPPAGQQGGPNLTLCADRGRAMGCQLRSTARDLTSVLVT